MTPRCCSLVALICGNLALCAAAADWPQWRGPDRDGISPETGLLDQWPQQGPKLLWKVDDIGSGYSTPAVVGDRLYLLNNHGMDDEFVQALSVNDGSQIWSVRLGKVGPNQGPQYPGARSTPTVDGELLYALGSDGDLACLETESGDIRWKKNLRTDLGGQPGKWAYSESPLVDGEKLVCTPGGNEATLVALNKLTGEVIWKSSVPGGEDSAYSSIVRLETNGGLQYVQFLGGGLVGVDAETGKFLWRYEKTAQGSPANIPTPVVHENHVYSATGRGGAALVRVESSPEDVKAEEVYFSTKLPKAIGGAVKVGDYLYGSTDQGLVCADYMTGEVEWQDRSIGACSLLYADGHLYLHGENGEIALVEATPEAYREKGRAVPPDQPDRGRSKAWTYPALADGRFYIHDLGTLWCYDVEGR